MLCGDGVGCAGCVRAHLYCQNDKVVVMCGGRTAISRRVQEKKKPRLLVDVEDQLLPKPMSKCLRARACSKRQQLIDRLQPHLRLASQTFSRCASLLLLHRPATPASSNQRWPVRGGNLDERFRAKIGIARLEMAGRKGDESSDFWPSRPHPPWISCFVSISCAFVHTS